MGLFGNKDDDKKKLIGAEEADERLLAAIDEAEVEMEQDKEDRIAAQKEAIAKAKEEEANKVKAIKNKILKNLPNEGRRAYMMVTECVEAQEKFLKIKGKLYGELHKDDLLYIYRPGGTVIETKVSNIAPVAEEIAEDEVPESVEAVKNCPVVITVDVDALKLGVVPSKIAPKCSVASSIKPVSVVDKNTPVENPALLGMSLRYADFREDKDYIRTFFRHVVNARFIIVGHVDSENVDGEGKKRLRLISTKKEDGTVVLPIFTDLAALSAWKEIFADEENKPQVVVVTYPELVKLTEKEQMGFVINRFGPIAIEISRVITDKLVNSEAFKSQFAKRPKYSKETITDEAHKIFVGEVPASTESNNIRETLKKFGAAHSEIVSIGFLGMRRNNKNSYLVIVDCPKNVSREIFADIKNVCEPHMVAIKDISFSLYAETVFADQYFSDHAFEYVRNPNL